MIRTLTALPVYNEAAHLLPVLSEVRKYAEEILVVNDGSRDGTAEILSHQTDIQILTHETNLGYGAGLRDAFLFAIEQGYDVLVTIDCDGQHQPCLIPELAAAVFPPGKPPVDIVSGSRYLKVFPGASVPPPDRRRINLEITRMINDRLGFVLTDAFCGFKAYRVDALRSIDVTELGYAMPLEFWVQAKAAGLKIVEYPVPLVYLDEERSFGGSLDDSTRRLTYYREVFERALAAAHLPCSAGADE